MAGSALPGWRRQWSRPCAQVQSRFCAGIQTGAWTCTGPVLVPVRRLRHRQCHFSAGTTEGKFAHRASQNHAQAQSSAKSTPTPQNRSAPPTTERPCASPSPSLRSTSASAWAALSPQKRVRSWHPGKAGKGPLPKLPGRVLYRAAADRRNTTRATIRESSRHSYRAGRSSTTTQLRKTDTPVAGSTHTGWRRRWSRPCAQNQSQFCACFWTGVWACSGRRLLYARRPQPPGTGRPPGPTRAHSRRRPPEPTSTPRRRRGAST